MRYQAGDNLVLRSVAGAHMLVATGARALQSNDIIELSESGALLWKCLQKQAVTPAELTEALTAEYEVSNETAAADVQAFVSQLLDREAVKQYEENV